MAAISTSDFEAAKQQQERAQREKMFYTKKIPDDIEKLAEEIREGFAEAMKVLKANQKAWGGFIDGVAELRVNGETVLKAVRPRYKVEFVDPAIYDWYDPEETTTEEEDSSCRPFDAREEIKDLRNKLNMLEARVMQDSTPKPDMSVEDMRGVLLDALSAATSRTVWYHPEGCSVEGHIDMRVMAENVLKAVK